MICLVVSGGDAAELFQFAEEIFDQMTPFVHGEIARNRPFAIRLGRDYREHAARFELGSQGVIVEGFVGDQRFDLDVVDKGIDADAVVTLTWQQDEAGEIAETVDKSHDFCG